MEARGDGGRGASYGQAMRRTIAAAAEAGLRSVGQWDSIGNGVWMRDAHNAHKYVWGAARDACGAAPVRCALLRCVDLVGKW